MISIHFDMETQDPDDVFTLCLLATHPRVKLRGVTLFPGGLDQVGLVKHILERLGRSDVPVGAVGIDDGKSRVSAFHYKWLGNVAPAEPDGTAVEVLLKSSEIPHCDLLTGAPLRNVHAALQHRESQKKWSSRWECLFGTWFCQGGFAGSNIVPPEMQLEKFKNRLTCPTFNLNGDVRAARELLGSPRMAYVYMVSKNVCHGLIFGPEQAQKMPRGAHAGLDLILDGMALYFRNNPSGKALHDTVAAALAIAPKSATWVEGEPYRVRGEWGFRSMEQIYGHELGWPMGITDHPRRITTAVNVEAMYSTWSA